ncbi:Xylose isomerase-like TIM barrel [Poriferisphaera corsica]|uniref:Xylose isomerase-like TIM barrel n=1 Tax=Poriferisphaera corsica TaxID=2528020 RepID=A0A517YTG3_9BACT|nr:TIM barrel protein [Poriferisphaera corsica]QDU33501.1 Xylose isomerase-like TIM barrel [Poriferisphaera corsica]
MLFGGLVSITFRQLGVRDIVELVKEAGLKCIEWGSDVHVPTGDVKVADEVRKMMRDEGLRTAAYGSYYRVGEGKQKASQFERVLESAVALGAPVVRVWAGSVGTEEASEEQWGRVIEDGKRIAALSNDVGVGISFEFHNQTLTDHGEAAVRLVTSIGCENVSLYWQPLDHAMGRNPMDDLNCVADWLRDVHVFSWAKGADGGGIERQALVEREDDWRGYLKQISGVSGDHCVMIEFVKGDDPGQFLEDAAVLRKWIDEVSGGVKEDAADD